MKFSYRFSNLLGTVYNSGNVCYSSDGNVLYSPVGNRISVFDLVNHTSYTLPFESRKNISRICVSNNGRYIIAVDVDGKGIFANLKKRIVLYRFSFESPISDIHFSPDDKLIAVAVGKRFQLWYTPSEERHFAPMEKYLDMGYHFDTITSIQWSNNGDYIVTGSADMNVRIFAVREFEGFIPALLSGHHAPIVNAFFTEDDMKVVSVGEDGAVTEWGWSELDEEDWKNYARRHARGKGRVSEEKEEESEEEEKEEVKEVNDNLSQENELLKKQMEAMQAQMELLVKQVSMNTNTTNTTNQKPERNIEFINMVPGTLVLRGNQIWKIEGQFNSRSFLEREARIIVNNMQNTIRSGYVYIADYDFIQENELTEVYDIMLSDKQLKDLLNKNFKEVVEIYKTVPKAQQDIIVRMIKERKESGVQIDANILIQIGELCGQDLLRGVEYEDGE